MNCKRQYNNDIADLWNCFSNWNFLIKNGKDILLSPGFTKSLQDQILRN